MLKLTQTAFGLSVCLLFGCGGSGSGSGSGGATLASSQSSSVNEIASSSSSLGESSSSSSSSVDSCDHVGPGENEELGYSYDLSQLTLEVKNNNLCNDITVLGVLNSYCFSVSWCTHHPFSNDPDELFGESYVDGTKINSYSITLGAGDSVVLESPPPRDQEPWEKPKIVYKLSNGQGYVTDDTGHQIALDVLEPNQEILGTFPEYRDAYMIETWENPMSSGCEGFTWLDRDAGTYKIYYRESEAPAYCVIGEVSGVDDKGDGLSLPGYRFFIRKPESPLAR